MVKNEGDSFTITAKPFDQDNNSFSPTTARYKIECVTSGRTIRNWTTLTASSSMAIEITPDDNVIINDSNKTERRQLQVQTEYGTSTQNVFPYEWDVRNLE